MNANELPPSQASERNYCLSILQFEERTILIFGTSDPANPEDVKVGRILHLGGYLPESQESEKPTEIQQNQIKEQIMPPKLRENAPKAKEHATEESGNQQDRLKEQMKEQLNERVQEKINIDFANGATNSSMAKEPNEIPTIKIITDVDELSPRHPDNHHLELECIKSTISTTTVLDSLPVENSKAPRKVSRLRRVYRNIRTIFNRIRQTCTCCVKPTEDE